MSERKHCFYLPPEECQPETICLGGAEAHHALDVLRVHPGARVMVIDGAGHELLCQVTACERRQVRLSILEIRVAPPLPYRLTLLQALPKGKLMEAIIQKATELGVARIVPLLSERVVTHLNQKDAEHRHAKWRATAIESIKQCGSAWLPDIELPVPPQDWLRRKEPFDLSLVGSLQSDSRHPKEYLESFVARHDRRPATVSVWIGPEGDFSPAELEVIRSAGALPISLGRLVLRTETAAVYCLSILNYELSAQPGGASAER